MSIRKRHGRRGLTLLEVLVASAILAMLAAACLPVIARAMVLLREDAESTAQHFAVIDLAVAADAFIAEPDSIGAASASAGPLHEITWLEIPWPVILNAEGVAMPSPSADAIIVQAMSMGDPANADHLWLAFTCGGVKVYRWVSIPQKVVSVEREGLVGGPP